VTPFMMMPSVRVATPILPLFTRSWPGFVT
jgi:hypothetical protein